MALSPGIRARFAQALRACVAQRWAGQRRAWVLRELAQRCACSESAASNLLAGRANPSYPMLHRLAHALEVQPALLVPPDDQWQLHGNPRPCAPKGGQPPQSVIPQCG